MNNGKILWADDEIDLLKGHLIFLKNKGYDVTPVSNGMDALEECGKQSFDLIMLDEMMPGLTGLETLQKIKEIQPQTPVIMVTKSEEEDLMDQAIGSKIADYLIKPVNPHQILLALKKNIHRKEIESEVTQMTYRSDYQKIAMMIDSCDEAQETMEWQRCLPCKKKRPTWALPNTSSLITWNGWMPFPPGLEENTQMCLARS